MRSSKVVLIYTTFPNAKSAQRVCEVLVKEKLIACATIQAPCQSLYVWKAKLCRDKENVVFLKTGLKNVKALEKRFTQLHPFEVPCFVVLSPQHVNAAYEAWVKT